MPGSSSLPKNQAQHHNLSLGAASLHLILNAERPKIVINVQVKVMSSKLLLL